jgi:glycosyltransferase involved in cell wall biosynthesis
MAQIAVVIPTRNRGALVVEAVRAVLRDSADLELVVVDQSADDATQQALREFEGDARLRVVRARTHGASNARNAGVAETKAPVVAFTDDDCRPVPGWASSVLKVFQSDPEAALVFGRVRLPPNAQEIGYAPSFEPQSRIQREVPLPDGDLGIGASFGVRRGVLESLGGFDPLLGPGAPFFRGAEETDLLIRALHAGLRVVNAAECEVLHVGVRAANDVRALHVTYQFAVGAAFGKHARLSGMAGALNCWRWVAYYVRKLVRDALAVKRPRPGVLVYFVAGALLTFRYGLDPVRPVFRRRLSAGYEGSGERQAAEPVARAK